MTPREKLDVSHIALATVAVAALNCIHDSSLWDTEEAAQKHKAAMELVVLIDMIQERVTKHLDGSD